MRLTLAVIFPTFLAAALSACGSSPSARNIGPDGFGAPARAEGDVKRQAIAVGLAQSGIPQSGLGLAYVIQEPGFALNGATVTLNGSSPYALRSGTYLAWEVEPGLHLLEAWRDGKRLASRTISVSPDRTTYVKFAIKNDMGGLLYLQPTGALEGSAFVQNATFAVH